MAKTSCLEHPEGRLYYEEYDMFACGDCDRWLEAICKCDNSVLNKDDVEEYKRMYCFFVENWLRDKMPAKPSLSPRKGIKFP